MTTKNKIISVAEIKAVGEGEARTFTAKINTSAVDRDGEVVLPRGADIKDYRKNPVVMWNHDYGLPPIGKATDIKIEADHITATVQMASTPFAQEIHTLMREGMIRGTSIGFVPTESPRSPTKGDLAKYGDNVRRIYGRWKMLEFSVTPLPANQEALITAVSKHVLTPARAKELFGLEVPTEPLAKKTVRYFIIPQEKRAPVDMAALVKQAVAEALAKRFGRPYA